MNHELEDQIRDHSKNHVLQCIYVSKHQLISRSDIIPAFVVNTISYS